jgi:hypothetical protein
MSDLIGIRLATDEKPVRRTMLLDESWSSGLENAFIEPPQADVIETILRHCGLWCPSSPRAPPGGDGSVHHAASSDEPRELTFVDEATLCGRPADFPRRTSDARAVRARAGFRV